MQGGHVAYALASVFAIALLITISFGITVLGDVVTEMKKSNERPVETDWTTWPGWPEWPEWPSEYPVKYTIEWPDDQDVSITHYKPIWADDIAQKLTQRGGRIMLLGTENYYLNKAVDDFTVAADEYKFIITKNISASEKETVYIFYEAIEWIIINEPI